MIRSAIGWLRVVLPPGWTLLVFVLIYLLLEGLYFWFPWWFGFRALGSTILNMRDTFVALACVCYGAFRLAAFHPVFRLAYFEWLKRTPWTSKKPLPVGPVHLTPQDVVILAVFVLLLHNSQHRLLIVPSAFLVPYLLCACMSFWLTAERWMAYLLLFGLGLAMRLSLVPFNALCVLGFLYLLTYSGLRKSLATFPWKLRLWETVLAYWKKGPKQRFSANLGWPFGHLPPKRPEYPFGRLDGVLISLLAGWWLYAIAATLEKPAHWAPLAVFYAYTCIGCIVGRVVLYCGHHWPPISLWGRIWTLRWIIPGYDKVFIAPICILLVGIITPWACWAVGLTPEISMPVSLSLVLLVTLNMGPRLSRWRLTGSHRIAPGIAKTAEFIKI